MNERSYIFYRKLKAFGNKIYFYICRIFPINKKLISVCTFEGKGGFGCNPKYIVEELHRRNPDYRFVWFVNKDIICEKEFPDYIKKVANTTLSRAYWLSTSKIWIDNYRKPYGTCKRKNQFYINTWHGTIGFKSTGLWRGKEFSKMAYLVSKNDSDMVDRITIDSEWCKEMFPKGLVYDGEFIMSGAPRSDAMFEDRAILKSKIIQRFALEQNVKLIMFAPTYRERSAGGVRSVFEDEWSLDFERLISVLEKKFGGEWYICLRVHPQLSAEMAEHSQDFKIDRILDVSKDDDMYDLLPAMDALITDYSSVAMDASFGDIPVFIYADDIEQYTINRGSLLWNIHLDLREDVKNNKIMTPGIDVVLPYSISSTNEELEKNIMEFDIELYKKKMEQFKLGVDLVFDGKASKRVADVIESQIGENK
jgi:CDP-glycerol glycerophosphotransferase